jgi:hypothetical protein
MCLQLTRKFTSYHRHAVITRTSRSVVCGIIELIKQSPPSREALSAGKVRIEHLPRPRAHF